MSAGRRVFTSELAFLDALREVLGLDPIMARSTEGPLHYDAWPPSDSGGRMAPRRRGSDR